MSILLNRVAKHEDRFSQKGVAVRKVDHVRMQGNVDVTWSSQETGSHTLYTYFLLPDDVKDDYYDSGAYIYRMGMAIYNMCGSPIGVTEDYEAYITDVMLYSFNDLDDTVLTDVDAMKMSHTQDANATLITHIDNSSLGVLCSIECLTANVYYIECNRNTYPTAFLVEKVQPTAGMFAAISINATVIDSSMRFIGTIFVDIQKLKA